MMTTDPAGPEAAAAAPGQATVLVARSREPGPEPSDRPGPLRRLVRGTNSSRTRILVVSIVLIALASACSVLVIRAVLLLRLDERIDAELTQEVEEFSLLVAAELPTGTDPDAVELARLFDLYFERNVPAEDETVLGIVDGAPYKRSASEVHPLDQLPEVAEWAVITDSVRGDLETPGGSARYLAVPVISGDATVGTFVVARYPAGERAEVDDAVRVAALVTASVGLLAVIALGAVVGRLLRPLDQLADTARRIRDDTAANRIGTLGERAEVGGASDLADVAVAFNTMLDRLDESFSEHRDFMDDAGHELRTPITVIRGHLELLGDDPDEIASTRELVLDELDRMGRLVDDLLLLATVGRQEVLRREPIDLVDLVVEIVAKARTLGERRWSVDTPDHVVFVADRDRLTQAMLNLARNAVRHTPPGGEIVLGGGSDGESVHLWVTDRGEGIDPAELPHLFERFRRGRGISRSDRSGAGLGLAIVAAVAEAHGGDVSAVSALGEGSTFTIRIPLTEEAPES